MVLTSRYAARSAAETAESVTLFVTPSMASSETPKRLSVSSASPSSFAQLVGQQSAGAQVAVLRGQRVGRNVALKLLKHSLLHLGIDEVGDRLDEHCGEQRRADERDHHAHKRHQAADKALARAEKREHRQHGSQDEINDKCIIHAFHLPFK